jgi:hypothetical protein
MRESQQSWFDHEKLEVHREAIFFIACALGGARTRKREQD